MGPIEENCPQVTFALSALASLVFGDLYIQKRVLEQVDHVQVGLLVEHCDSGLHAVVEGGEPGLALEFLVERKQPGVAHCAVVEPHLVFAPHVARKRSL